MVLKPKHKKPRLRVTKSKPKLKVKSTKQSDVTYKKWSDEEVEDFILNSYTGKIGTKSFPNFPCKPVMKKKEIIPTITRLQELADEMISSVPVFSFDTETNTLRTLSNNSEFRIVDITISWGENNNYEIPLGHIRDEDIDRNLYLDDVVRVLTPVFANPYVTIIGANIKFDLHVLKRIGIDVVTRKVFDTNLASWICDENTFNGLKENSAEKMLVPQEHFKEVTNSIPKEVKKQFGYKANANVKDFGLVLIDDGSDYCIGDAFYTFCLFLGFRKEIVDEGMDKIYYKKMIPFLFVLFEMEEQGVTVDVEKLKEMGELMQKDLDRLQYEIYEKSGCIFNIGSSAQKSLILFGEDDYTKDWDEYLDRYKQKYANKLSKSKKGLDVVKVKATYEEKRNDPERLKILANCFNFKVQGYTQGGSPSTDNDTIWKLSKMSYKNKRKQEGVEMCSLIMEYSKLSKLKTAFVDGILEQLYTDGKAHPNFNQIGTDSGRLSCSSPNLDLTVVGHYMVTYNSKLCENGEALLVA